MNLFLVQSNSEQRFRRNFHETFLWTEVEIEHAL